MSLSSRFDQKESILLKGVNKFLPFWPFFLGLLILAVSGCFLYLKMAPPKYLSTATILINDEKKGAEDAKMVDNFNFFSSKKIIENEIEVLHSRSLLFDVVRNLNLNVPIYERHSLKYVSAYLTSPIVISVENLSDRYGRESDVKIPFEFIQSSRKVKLFGSLYEINRWVHTPLGTTFFKVNPKQSTKTNYPLFFSIVNDNQATSDLAKEITVTPVSKLSTIVRLELEDEVPQRGNDILNSLAGAYYGGSLRLKKDLAENTLNFINSRIKLVQGSLDSLERGIQSLKSKEGIVDLGVQAKEFIETGGANEQKAGDISMKLAVLDQVESYIVSRDNRDVIVPSTVGISDPVLSSLLQKLLDDETNYQKLKGLTAENNPMLLSISREIAKIRPAILENIQSQRRSLQASKIDINKTNTTNLNALNNIPLKEKKLLELTRQQGIVSNLYTFLLQKREEAVMSYSSNIADNRIVDHAAASVLPVKPNKMLCYVGAVLLAICGGCIAIIVKESLSGKILFKSEIKEIVNYPLIGEIAWTRRKLLCNGIVTKKGLVADQFRNLRGSVLRMNAEGKKKTILVASSSSQEGKSFVATNLGLSLANADKKVLILDFNFGNPSINKYVRIPVETAGISNYFANDGSLGNFVRGTELHHNLFILSAGNNKEFSHELVESSSVDKLLAFVKDEFDYLILDSAGISATAVPYVLMPPCDFTLFIIRQNLTSKSALHRLKETAETYQLNNLLIVFNGVSSRGWIG